MFHILDQSEILTELHESCRSRRSRISSVYEWSDGFGKVKLELYWKNTKIEAGTLLQVEERGNEVLDEYGRSAVVTWKILEIRSRGEGDDYYDPEAGKTYSMQKVMKRRRLRKKNLAGELLSVPACSDYLVLREYHNRKDAGMRCFSVDMLGLLWDVRVLGGS